MVQQLGGSVCRHLPPGALHVAIGPDVERHVALDAETLALRRRVARRETGHSRLVQKPPSPREVDRPARIRDLVAWQRRARREVLAEVEIVTRRFHDERSDAEYAILA